MTRRNWDARSYPRIENEVHNLLPHTEADDAGREGVVVYLSSDDQERVRQVDGDTPQRYFRRDVILIGVGAEDIRFGRLANGLDDAQSRGIGVLEDDVDSTR